MNHGKGTYCEVYNPEITLLDRSGDASHPVWVEKRQAPGTWIELCRPEFACPGQDGPCPRGSSGLRVPRGALHPPGNGSFGNVEAQHQEFTVNAWRAPTGILDDHPENKFSHFFGNSLSAEQSPSFGDGPPVECKS